MASALYVHLASEFEDLSDRYTDLLQEFRVTGDDEIFIDLDADLCLLSEKAHNLDNLEERYEITNSVTRLRSLIKSMSYSAY